MEVFNLKCTNGLLKVYEDRVIISRKTIAGFLAQGLTGDRTFFFKDLSSVEYRKPTMFANGYIKFVAAGTREVSQKPGLFSTTAEAARDPNSLILRAFNKEIPNKSEEIYTYILERISESRQIGTCNNSNADEIMKYKQLLDNGAITQEEYDKKKQELLK